MKKDANKVKAIREVMLQHVKTLNKSIADRITRCDPEDDAKSRLRSNRISPLYKQHRLKIKNAHGYGDTIDLYGVFAILHEQTYIESRVRVQCYSGKPYIYAWGVCHDYLTRIIADGAADGVAVTVARGNNRTIIG